MKHWMLTDTHDKLGWDNFVEGRICNTYLQLVADGNCRIHCHHWTSKVCGPESFD